MTDPADTDQEEARYARIELAYQEARFALCAVLGEEFLGDYPKHGVGWALLGLAYMKLSRYTEAQAALKRAIRFVAEDHRAMPYAWMGDLYARKGDHRRAAWWYEKIILEAPDDGRGYLYLGMAQSRVGKHVEAETAFRKALETGGVDLFEARLNLAYALRAQERWDESLAELEQLALAPTESVRAEIALADVRAVVRHRRTSSFRVIQGQG